MESVLQAKQDRNHQFRAALDHVGYDSSKTLTALLDEMADGVFLFDVEGRFIAATQRGAALLGYSVDDLVGRTVTDTLAPEEISHFREQMARRVRGESPAAYERKLRHRDGSELIVEISTPDVSIPSGSPRAILSIVHDVTQQRRDENLTRFLVEGLTPIVGDHYLVSLVRALAAALDVFGVGVCQPDGNRPGHLFADAWWMDGEYVQDIQYEIEHTPCALVLEGRTIFHPCDVGKAFPKDQMLLDLGIESYLGLPMFGRDGRCLGLIVIVDKKPLDLDPDHWLLKVFTNRAALEIEHILNEDALRHEEHRSQRLLEQVPAVIFESSLDLEEPLNFVGPGIEKLTGYRPDEWGASFTRWLELVHPEDRESTHARIVERLKARAPWGIEYRIRAKDGSTVWLRDEAAVIEEGDRELLVGVLVDVTTQRVLEQQVADSRRLESIGQLAAGVAHDFNNLLMTSIGQLSLAKLEISPEEETFNRMVEIEKALLRATGLTRQLLSLAKGGHPVRRRGSIDTLLRESTTFAVSGTRVTPEFSIHRKLWPVSVDRTQLRQVIENLVHNALQAMPDGGHLFLDAGNVDLGSDSGLPLRAGCYVRCSLRDEGVGIEPDVLSKVFDLYFTTKEKGFGLGLASSHAILRRHDGHIAVESTPGEGTTVTFYLPAEAEGVSATTLAEDDDQPLPRALLLEDDENVSGVVRSMLERLGVAVTVAATGEEAIEHCRTARQQESRFDLAILDLTIAGGMGGLEASQVLRTIDPEIQMVVTSGYSESRVMSHFTEFGFVECLSKPYSYGDLSRLVKAVVGTEKTAS